MSKRNKIIILVMAVVCICIIVTIFYMLNKKDSQIINGENNETKNLIATDDSINEDTNVELNEQNDIIEQNTKNEETKQDINQSTTKKENKVDTTKIETRPKEEKQQEQQTTKVETKQEVKQETKVEVVKPQEPKKEEPIIVRCTNNSNHGMNVGNSNKWFDSKAEAIAQYESEIKKWGDKWTKFEIDDETYYANCPSGYEVWSCPYCNKWTINYYKH